MFWYFSSLGLFEGDDHSYTSLEKNVHRERNELRAFVRFAVLLGPKHNILSELIAVDFAPLSYHFQLFNTLGKCKMFPIQTVKRTY